MKQYKRRWWRKYTSEGAYGPEIQYVLSRYIGEQMWSISFVALSADSRDYIALGLIRTRERFRELMKQVRLELKTSV